jgi:tetratricopeptide (TPR) repeat protein
MVGRTLRYAVHTMLGRRLDNAIRALASVLLLLVGATSSSARRPSQGPPTAGELQSFFGKKQLATVRTAASLEALLLLGESSRAGCGAAPLCDHAVAKRQEVPPELLEPFRALLVDPKRYDRPSIKREIISGCIFDPGLALRFTDSSGNRVDVLFCLRCGEVMIDPGRRPTNMAGLPPEIIRLFKQVFPGDRRVQVLFDTYPHLPKWKLYELVKAGDAGAVEQALATWKLNGGEEDPEYWVTGANSWSHLGQRPTVSIGAATGGDRGFPITEDKTSKVVGSISEGEPKIDVQRVKKAIAFLDEGTRRFPHRLDLFVGRAHLYRSVGDLPGELAALEALVKNPRQSEGHFETGPGKPLEGSIEDYQVDMLTSYASEHFEKGGAQEMKAVREIGRLGMRLFPRRAHGYNLVAAAASSREDWPEVKRQLESALRVAPDDPLVVANLGDCLEKLGDKKGAITRYRRVLELTDDPNLVHQAQSRLSALEAK